MSNPVDAILKPLIEKYNELSITPDTNSFFVRPNIQNGEQILEEELKELLKKDIHSSQNISVYLHFPLCSKPLCKFCHYVKSYDIEKLKDEVIKLLCKEIEIFSGKVIPEVKTKEITSFYIGGGTPSLMNKEDINSIFEVFNNWNFAESCERTIEATPNTLNDEKINLFTTLGFNNTKPFFNRISVGVQTFDEDILKKMERSSNNKEIILKNLSNLFKVCNKMQITTNIDLIYGFPGQNEESLLDDVKELLEINGGPTSITLYRLRLRRVGDEVSELMREYEKKPESFPEQLKTYKMKFKAKEFLKSRGYDEGPIGWFTKGKTPRVYSDRWSSKVPLIGFGQASYSYTQNLHYRNEKEFDMYSYYVGIKNVLPINNAYKLDQATKLKREVSFALKMMKEISLQEIAALNGDLINFIISNELMEKKNDKLTLTEAGILLVEEIISSKIWERVKVFFTH